MNKLVDVEGVAQAIAAHAFGVARKDLRGEAKAVATYLAHRVLGLARASGTACRKIEARRRDPQFDRVIVQLETLLRSAVAA